MKVLKVPLQKVKPAAYNPRKTLAPTDAEYIAIKRSIEAFGLVEPLVWNRRSGNLVGGHQRFAVLKDLGHKEVLVSVVDLDARKEKALNVALNKISGRWDMEKLKGLLIDLDAGDMDLSLTGFDEDELKGLIDQPLDDQGRPDIDSIPAASKGKPTTRRGDVWELGGHRLMCGDSTSREDIQRLMGGARAQMVFTDPPYGVDYRSRSETQDFKPIAGDEKRDDDLVRRLLLPALKQAVNATDDTAAFYIWHASSTREDFAFAMKAAGLVERQYLIWAKNNFVMGHADYHWAHEPCFYAGKDGQRPAFHGDRTQQTLWTAVLAQARGAGGEGREVATTIATGILLTDGQGGQMFILPKAPKGKRARKIRVEPGQTVALSQDGAQSSLWLVAKDSRIDHPTQKPVELAVRAIENSSLPDQIILDLLLGSGCTLMGAEQTGRRCYGMELDPVYCDQIVQRWERYTGKTAQRMKASQKAAA